MTKKCTNKECCCKCGLNRKVYCHPCNTIGKGPISKLLGYVCDAFRSQGEEHLIFMDRHHSGGCECFTKKNKK